MNKLNNLCQTVTITGLPLLERTVFAFIMAQYLSLNGKTLIVEKDFKYLTLSDIASKSGISYLEIDIEQFYQNPMVGIQRIKDTDKRLIVLVSCRRSQYNYSFICNVLFNNLANDLKYFIMEMELDEMPPTNSYITVLPNNLIDLLKTVENMPNNYKTNSSFVAVNMRQLKELSILHGEALEIIIRDLLQIPRKIRVPIYNLNSLKLGGDLHDLRMLLKSRST